MKAVFLDSDTMPLSFEREGPIQWVLRSSTKPFEVVSALLDVEIAITNKVNLTASILEQLPKLKYVCVAASGYDCVDIAACQARGVKVSNAPGYSSLSVAEHVMTSIFMLRRRFFEYQRLAQTEWHSSQHFCVHGGAIRDVRGAILGIVGRGAIGQSVAELASALGMKVLFAEHREAHTIRKGYTAFEDVLRQADILTLHCPLTTASHNLLDAKAFKVMKSSSLLINTARGPLVELEALKNALTSGLIAGASIDVLDTEPPAMGHRLIGLDHPNLIVTPHIAWASTSSVARLDDIIVANVMGFYDGNPINLIC